MSFRSTSSGAATLNRTVLGLFDGPSGGAAVIHEGTVLAAAEEDRLIRRHRVSGLPRASVQCVLRQSGIHSSQVMAVLVATRDATYAEGIGSTARPPFLVRFATAPNSPEPISRMIRVSFAGSRRRRLDEALRSEFGFSCPILFLDHHLAHAAGSAFSAGISDCLAITMDGGADGAWATVTSFRNGRPELLARETGPYSFLAFLEDVCDKLHIPDGIDRFRRLEDLSKRGEPVFQDRLKSFFRIRNGRVEIPEGMLRTGGPLSRIPQNVRREVLAASALRAIGEAVREVARHWIERSDHSAVVLGGDLFEICPVVRSVLESAQGRSVHLPTVPGDDGLAIGAAFSACLPGFLPKPLPIPARPLPSPFLGIAYGDDILGPTLASEGLDFRKSGQIEREVGRVLAEGKSIAHFHGRTEIGNSSLGNRSILRSPLGRLRSGQVSFVLAPNYYHALVPVDAFHSLFEDEGMQPENLLAAPLPCTPLPRFLEQCPDIVGPRGRVKVQTLTLDSNPRLFKILREFELWTGLPCLAVAPFRLPDEPLVSTPLHALRIFRLLGADFAAFGSYLARSRSGVASPLDALETEPLPTKNRVRERVSP
jgi:carbamoyltransferase